MDVMGPEAWVDAETAACTLEGIGGREAGYRTLLAAPVSAEIKTLVIHGIPDAELPSSEQLRRRTLGALRLDGLERDHVKQVLARTYVASEELVQAVAENPSLTDRDVGELTHKIWDGKKSQASSIWPPSRRTLRECDRVAARALAVLADGWYDECWGLPALVERLAGGGVEAVEVYDTLARDTIAEKNLSGVNERVARDLVEKALLLGS